MIRIIKKLFNFRGSKWVILINRESEILPFFFCLNGSYNMVLQHTVQMISNPRPFIKYYYERGYDTIRLKLVGK